MPDTELWSATGNDANGRFPDFAGGKQIDLTVIGPFTIGPGPCQTKAVACVVGIFFGSALQQPCTPDPTVMGAGALPPPQAVAPNGAAVVFRYPPGTSTSTLNHWRNFRTTNETSPNPIAQAGWYDAAANAFQPFASPLNNSFTVLDFDEPTLHAAVLHAGGTFPGFDIGTGGSYPSVSFGDAIGIRMDDLEAALDPPLHLTLVLLSATAPTGLLELGLFGAPGEFSLLALDAVTLATFPLFRTSMNPVGANVTLGAAGPFQTAIWNAPPLPVGNMIPGVTLWLAGFSLDLGSFRITPTNTTRVHTVP